jgi:Amt family ammonium transporter
MGFQIHWSPQVRARWGMLFLLLLFSLVVAAPGRSFAQDADAPTEAADAEDAAVADEGEETAGEGDGETTSASQASAAVEPTAAVVTMPTTGDAMADLRTEVKVWVDTLWVMVAGMLVFFMNLGFACVESGFCRAKNCVNILSKNFIVFAVTSLFFWLLGFGLMFGAGGDYIGKEGVWMLSGADNSPATGDAYSGAYTGIAWPSVPLMAKFFFQLVFAGTAATIVSGAVAERIKYLSFIVFSAMMAVFIYPVVGHWIWGGGWLATRETPFLDFAGSTQVHSIGGWAALVGILFLGPRIGKYSADGRVKAIPGHNMTAATIGCFVLWLGWFGFNPGSTMGVDVDAICDVAVTTNTAAAVATLTATATAWIVLGKPDIGMTLNGCLAGLVAITAPCAYVSVMSSAIIGAIAGVLVVLGVMAFDRLHIDDPVGATSVHLLNGVFGTLCVGLFAEKEILASRALTSEGGLFFGGGTAQLMSQLAGIVATAVYVVAVSSICWAILKFTMGIRVSREEEIEGLDLGEHGNEAYHGFAMVATPEG